MTYVAFTAKSSRTLLSDFVRLHFVFNSSRCSLYSPGICLCSWGLVGIWKIIFGFPVCENSRAKLSQRIRSVVGPDEENFDVGRDFWIFGWSPSSRWQYLCWQRKCLNNSSTLSPQHPCGVTVLFVGNGAYETVFTSENKLILHFDNMALSNYLTEQLSSADRWFSDIFSTRFFSVEWRWYVNERALKEASKDSFKVLFQRLFVDTEWHNAQRIGYLASVPGLNLSLPEC